MPTYEYQCTACDHRFEAEQRITDAPLDTCPSCSEKKVRRLISATAFHLKGSGWYKTDYASSSSNSTSTSDSKDSSSNESSGSDAKSSSATENSSSAGSGGDNAITAKSPESKPSVEAAKPKSTASSE